LSELIGIKRRTFITLLGDSVPLTLLGRAGAVIE
jgi:hypothetical protein